MKINSISNISPSFGHISKQAVDSVRAHAEGYMPNYLSKGACYKTDTKYNLMNSSDLKRLENLTLRASMLDNSWIHCELNGNLTVEFYKNCNPNQVCRFDDKNEGDVNSALDVLESAVIIAESAEGEPVDEDKKPEGVWDRTLYEPESVTYHPDRFKSADDNRILNRIYNNTLYIQPCADSFE